MVHFAITARRGVFRFLLVILAGMLVWSAAATSVVAQEDTEGLQPRIDNRDLGEEEQILQRREWFLESRRAGTTSDDELWLYRRNAVEETRQALEAQRVVQSLGFADQPNFWVAKGPSPSTFGGWAFGNVSGRTQAIAADWSGGVLYVGGGSGGVWKSTNDGLSWTSIFDSAGTLAVGAITVDPNDPNVIWVGTGDNVSSCESYFGIGLLRSLDGGQTWEERNGTGANTLEELASFANVLVDPRNSNHLVVGGRYRGCASGSQQDGGIYTSTDGGVTWINRIANTEIYEIAQDPSVLDIYWAGTDDGVYKSVDNGVTWTLQTSSGLPNGSPGRTEIAIAPSDSNTVYALFAGGSSFWRTTDGGATWTQMTSGGNACDGQCWYNMVIRVHRTNPDIVYRGTVHFFKSVNGGGTWTDLSNSWGSSQTVHQDMHSLLMHPTQPDKLYVGGDGGLWMTEDGGDNFQNLNGNLNITQFYAIGVDANDPERICGGAQDNSSLARAGTSDVWDRQAVTGDGFVCAINPVNPNYAYITSYPSGGYPNVWRSTSGLFGSFSDISGGGSGIISGDRINWVTPYILDPVDPSILYLGTHRVYRSANNGTNWTQLGPDLTGGSGSLRTLEVNRIFPTHVYSGSASGRVWRSTNSGTDWTDITSGLPSRSINDLGADPTNPDRVFATVGGFNTAHVWEWNDGSGWTARDGGLPNVPANTVVMLSADDVMVGTDVGIFRSFDGGQTFVPYMFGLPEGLVVTDLKYNALQDVMTAGTYGRGAWQTVVGAAVPILLVDSFEQPAVEVDGDGDTHIEPGETWSVRPVLRNAGGQEALGVTARLATVDSGITILDEIASFGDLLPGATAPADAPQRFVVDPSFVCGGQIVFDVVDIADASQEDHTDQTAALTVTVLDEHDTSITTSLVDEDFESPPAGWSSEAVDAAQDECGAVVYQDEWNLASRDAEHGTSYHCGNGPGNTISRADFSWLYLSGKDSESGPGFLVPSDATAAALSIVHWYDTTAGEDGGQVAIDAVPDGQDVFTTLTPAGGYPGGTLPTGVCNGLEGQPAFQGSSGGWVTSTFDLMPYKGQTVYLAFVFGSDKTNSGGEGWYVDDVKVEYQQLGAPICQITLWPGSVPTAHFNRVDETTIEATWDESCNIGEFPVQTYSIQAGDLDALSESGTYTHVPVSDQCDRTSPGTFTPGSGNEYYLVVPAAEGREGGAGFATSGAARPQVATTCGEPRPRVCP